MKIRLAVFQRPHLESEWYPDALRRRRPGSAITIGGTFTAPNLASITRGSGSTPTMTLQLSAVVTFPALTTITDVNLTMNGTAAFTAAALTSYTSTDGTAQLAMQGSGCSLTTNALATITNLKINLSGGAILALPGVTQYIWNVNGSPVFFAVYGTGTALSLANLTSLSFNNGTGGASAITAQTGGHITAAGLAAVVLGVGNTLAINADGSGSQITVTALSPTPAGVTKTQTNGGVVN